jgi:hypothetical protein
MYKLTKKVKKIRSKRERKRVRFYTIYSWIEKCHQSEKIKMETWDKKRRFLERRPQMSS